MTEDCLLCGAPEPAGHIVVVGAAGERIGRVCSSHTLREVTADKRDRLLLDITDAPPFDAIPNPSRPSTLHRRR